MIVVDTNILAYLVIPCKHTQAVERLWKKAPEWIAPRLWLDEFTNILTTYERNGIFDSAHADKLLTQAEKLMAESTFEVPANRTLAVARRTGCTAYDSQFIALAEEISCPLYTFDAKIVANCPTLAFTPK